MKESITPSGEPYVPKCEDEGKGSQRNRHKLSQDVRPQIRLLGVDEGFVGDPKSYTTWESPFEKKRTEKYKIKHRALEDPHSSASWQIILAHTHLPVHTWRGNDDIKQSYF